MQKKGYNRAGQECPNCGASIDHLVELSYVLSEWDVFPYEDGHLEFRFKETYYDIANKTEYQCPQCENVLFTKYDEARRFLHKNHREVMKEEEAEKEQSQESILASWF